MKKYTAEFSLPNSYGTMVASEDTVDELINTMISRGFPEAYLNKKKIKEWEKSQKYRYYGMNHTLQCGETKMTEYTSF